MPLNFKDLMTAMGQLDGLTAMMIECGGVVEEVGHNVKNFKLGDRVCALSNRSLATTSNVDYRLVHRVPDEMRTEEAAAIQISYATALYCLRDVGRLQKGESVLIHSAAGGFGQAAIAISKYLGSGNIYVTVGSEDKKAFIVEKFGIPEEHIFSSRNLSFKGELLQLTKGEGVDVVVNSLSGEAMFDSYKCLARFGRFVEIGKKDLLTNTRLEMQPLEKNITLSTVDLSLLMEYKKHSMQELLSTVFDLMANKKLEMLGPITTQSISQLEETLRQMQGGKHIGKFVMTLEDDAIVRVCMLCYSESRGINFDTG
jgi:emericellamide synthase (highly reducing iterative type I polyketide synthase)